MVSTNVQKELARSSDAAMDEGAAERVIEEEKEAAQILDSTKRTLFESEQDKIKRKLEHTLNRIVDSSSAIDADIIDTT